MDGNRGNSKYHYYGIRIKPTSPLINVNDDGSPITIRSSGHLKKSGQQAATQQTTQQAQQTTQQTQQNQGKVTSSGQKNADTHYDSHTQVPAEASPQVNISSPRNRLLFLLIECVSQRCTLNLCLEYIIIVMCLLCTEWAQNILVTSHIKVV